jgi:excisionase family DNA binding protein
MLGMKALIEAPTLPLPNPEEWCTVKFAAKRLNRSERTVRRMAAEGVLKIHRPRVATSGEQADMCWLAEVDELRDALMKSGRLIRKTAWRQ